jgi:hypothetical protein
MANFMRGWERNDSESGRFSYLRANIDLMVYSSSCEYYNIYQNSDKNYMRGKWLDFPFFDF